MVSKPVPWKPCDQFTSQGVKLSLSPKGLIKATNESKVRDSSKKLETVMLYLIICEKSKSYFFSPCFIYVIGQRESFKIFKEEAMHVATFHQLVIAKFCSKQEIIDVIGKPKEVYELRVKCWITLLKMNIASWKRIANYFKIDRYQLQACRQQ